MAKLVKSSVPYFLVLSLPSKAVQGLSPCATFRPVGTRLSHHQQLPSRSITLRHYVIQGSRYTERQYQSMSEDALSATNNDDDDEQETCERSKLAWDQCKTGAKTTHENFLDLFWKSSIFSYKWVLVLQISTMLAYLTFPRLGWTLLRARTSLLLTLDSVFLNIVYVIKELPALLVLLAAMVVILPIRFLEKSFGSGPVLSFLKNKVSQPMRRFALWFTEDFPKPGEKAGPVPRKNLGEFFVSSNAIFSLLLVLVLGPVVEELVYRRGILVGLKALWFKNKQPKENKEEIPSKSVPTVLGHSPWVLASSVVFAASHISNWAGPLRDVRPSLSLTDIQTRESMRFSASPLFQVLTTLWASLYIFSPIFEKNGLVASIGSHATWNLNTYFLGWSLTIRGMNRLRLSINKRILKRDSSKDVGKESMD